MPLAMSAMRRWLLLIALLPGLALGQTHVRQPFRLLWDYAAGAADRFEIQYDLGAYASVGLPPFAAGTYTLTGDSALTGTHSAVVRACIALDCSLDSNTVAFVVDVPAPAPIPAAPTGLRIVASVAPPSNRTVVLAPTGDTYLNLDSIAHGAEAALNTYTWPDFKIANAILMTFDLTSIPASSTVVSATLSLNLIESDVHPAPLYTITVHRIVNKKPVLSLATGFTYDGVNPWTPSACCDAGVPLAQADIGAAVDSKAVDKTLGLKTWSVTSIVHGWLTAPATNFGLLLNSDPAQPFGNYRFFSSSEDPVPGNRPSLSVVYR